MRAILVIDEMPENCFECRFCTDERCDEKGIVCAALNDIYYKQGDTWVDMDGGPLVCPLMPEPRRLVSPSDLPSDIFNSGWNAAMDLILGEEKHG